MGVPGSAYRGWGEALPKGLVFDNWGAKESQPIPEGHRPLHPPFARQQGHCFAIGVPGLLAGPSDTAADKRRSRLQLYEDGRPLGPRHSIYEDVVEHGGGRYNHFDSVVNFSASDNSDPARNGRAYTYRLVERTPKVLGVGGCHMNGAVRHLHNRRVIDVKGVGMGVAYSPLEGLRLVERLLGLRSEPEGIGRYAIATEAVDYALAPELDALDILMLEVTAHTDVLVGDLCLNRCAIITDFLNVALEHGDDLHGLAMQWYSNGLLKRNEEARAAAAAALLEALKGSDLDTEVNRQLVSEARGVRETVDEMAANTLAIQKLLGAPRLVVIYGPNVFFPDGRGMSWHSNLEADTRDLAARLKAPFVNIGELVRDKGVGYAVVEDMVHHTEPFMGDIGTAALAATFAHYGPLPPSSGQPASKGS